MKRYIYILLAILTISTLQGCIKSDYFGESNEAQILTFSITGETSNKKNSVGEIGVIEITVPGTANLANLTVTEATCSQLARFSVDPLTLHDFTKTVTIEVTAESGFVRKWEIIVKPADADRQITNSKMNSWIVANNGSKDISVGGKICYYPGKVGEATPWNTPAEANAYGGLIPIVTVSPLPDATSATYARVQTIMVPAAANFASAGVVTGALFTGKFIFNTAYAPLIGSNEPRKMVNIGTPFAARPKSFKVKMRYRRGKTMYDGKLKEITQANANGRPLIDSCDIYVILQRRAGAPAGQWYRIGAGHYRSSEDKGTFNGDDGFFDLEVPIVYGKPTDAELKEKPYLKAGGARGELKFYAFNGTDITSIKEVYTANKDLEPDYICVLFSSSAYGDEFWGALDGEVGKQTFNGSTLDVKDLEMLY